MPSFLPRRLLCPAIMLGAILVMTLAAVMPARALVPGNQIFWSYNHGIGAATTTLYDTVVDGAGNVYVTGSYNGATLPLGNGVSLTRQGGGDGFVAKFDPDGIAQWAQTIGGALGTTNGRRVALDAMGNLYVVGDTSRDLTAPTAMTRYGNNAGFLMKFDAATGAWQSTRPINGADLSSTGVTMSGLAVDGAGNAYVAGHFNNAALETPALALNGNLDAFVIKFGPTGPSVWARSFYGNTGGARASVQARALAVDAAGNTYLTGYYSSNAMTNPPLPISGVQPAFALKLDGGGTIQWSQRFFGTARVQPYGIAVDRAGTVHIAGIYDMGALTTPDLPTLGLADGMLLRLDGTTGATTLARRYGGAGANVSLQGLGVDRFGNSYLGGYFLVASLTEPPATLTGTNTALVIKVDTAGAVAWSETMGGTATNAGLGFSSVALDAAGVLHLGGALRDVTTIPPLTAVGSIDAVILRYGPTEGTLTVTRAGDGTGTVAAGSGALQCGATCSASYALNGTVTLTATPAAAFAGWSGDCTGTTATITVTMTGPQACTATFTATGPAPSAPPAPPPAFVAAPVPVITDASTVGSGTGSVSFASSFTNPQSLTFTATQGGGAALPAWLTFDPATVSFSYDVPLPATLPFQPVADPATGADSRAEVHAAPANTIYPMLLRVARMPVTLTATGAGQSYTSSITMNFYAPRAPVAISAVSASLDGALGNGRSGRAALSWDGGQMVFETAATNLFPASPNTHADIVRYDGLSGGRDRLSQTAIPGGGVANAADGASMNPAVSSDGRYAAFASDAAGITLTPSGARRQVYRVALGYPRVPLNGQATPAPELVSVTAAGVVGNAASDNPVLSQDGRYVAFDSAATNFTSGHDGTRSIWRKDLQTGALDLVMRGGNPSISWDGRQIVGEAEGQVYLRDMAAGTRLIAAGTAPRLSARADRIVFQAAAQVAVADVASGVVRNLAAGDQPDISADGRFVVYRSAAGQIQIHDIDRGVAALVTRTATGTAANGSNWNPVISGDGGTVGFGSNARDLVQGNPPGGQAYIAANPLPLPDRTGYWYMAGSGNGQGWVMERWGNRTYVGGLAYDAQGRSQWLAGPCTLSGLTCRGTLTHGPAFAIVTADTGASAGLSVGGAAGQTLTMFAVGGTRTSAFAGLPQTGWWYDPAARDGIGYFLGISTQPQADGSVAQIGYLAVLAYDATGRQVWQTAQATLAADLSFTGTLTQYAGGAPFGAATATTTASGTAVGQVRLTFDGTDRARITLPTGRSTVLTRFRF